MSCTQGLVITTAVFTSFISGIIALFNSKALTAGGPYSQLNVDADYNYYLRNGHFPETSYAPHYPNDGYDGLLQIEDNIRDGYVAKYDLRPNEMTNAEIKERLNAIAADNTQHINDNHTYSCNLVRYGIVMTWIIAALLCIADEAAQSSFKCYR